MAARSGSTTLHHPLLGGPSDPHPTEPNAFLDGLPRPTPPGSLLSQGFVPQGHTPAAHRQASRRPVHPLLCDGAHVPLLWETSDSTASSLLSHSHTHAAVTMTTQGGVLRGASGHHPLMDPSPQGPAASSAPAAGVHPLLCATGSPLPLQPAGPLGERRQGATPASRKHPSGSLRRGHTSGGSGGSGAGGRQGSVPASSSSSAAAAAATPLWGGDGWGGGGGGGGAVRPSIAERLHPLLSAGQGLEGSSGSGGGGGGDGSSGDGGPSSGSVRSVAENAHFEIQKFGGVHSLMEPESGSEESSSSSSSGSSDGNSASDTDSSGGGRVRSTSGVLSEAGRRNRYLRGAEPRTTGGTKREAFLKSHGVRPLCPVGGGEAPGTGHVARHYAQGNHGAYALVMDATPLSTGGVASQGDAKKSPPKGVTIGKRSSVNLHALDREQLDGGAAACVKEAEEGEQDSPAVSFATDPPSSASSDHARSRDRQDPKWKRQVHQILKGKWKGKYQVIANFKLESLSGTWLKSAMLLFYISIAFAFAMKMYTEKVTQIDNICSVGGTTDFGDTDGTGWNSSACMESFSQDEPIPIDNVQNVDYILCPSRTCLKWAARVPKLSVLNKMYFIGFTVEAYAPNHEHYEADMWFAGFSHQLNDQGIPIDNGELLPPSAFHIRNETYSNRTEDWEKMTRKFTCKQGMRCDFDFFPEPIYATSNVRHLQLLLLNADAMDPVLNSSDTQTAPAVAIIYTYWLESVIELCVRYGGLILVFFFMVVYTRTLGCRNFCGMRPHFRQHGTARSKPWLLEQKWTLIVLTLSVLYLNPMKLPSMYYFARGGLVLDGPGWTWRDRVFYFIDVNLPAYFINLVRMWMLIIYACCFKKPPKLSLQRRHFGRSWPYWLVVLWYITFLLQDWIRLKAEYRAYYVMESPDTGVWQGNLIANSAVFTVLIGIWMVAMVVFFLKASHDLIHRHYWKTKSRQLSFRMFVVLVVWHAIYVGSSVAYCWYQFQFGRAVLEDMVCHNVTTGHTVGDTITNIVFVLILTYFLSPVVFKPGHAPPDALDREWVSTKWRTPWKSFVNYQSNSTMYFFLWEREREVFDQAQHADSGLGNKSNFPRLNAAMRRVRRTVQHGRQRVEDGLNTARAQLKETRQTLQTKIVDSQWTQSFARRSEKDGTPNDSFGGPFAGIGGYLQNILSHGVLSDSPRRTKLSPTFSDENNRQGLGVSLVSSPRTSMSSTLEVPLFNNDNPGAPIDASSKLCTRSPRSRITFGSIREMPSPGLASRKPRFERRATVTDSDRDCLEEIAKPVTSISTSGTPDRSGMNGQLLLQHTQSALPFAIDTHSFAYRNVHAAQKSARGPRSPILKKPQAQREVDDEETESIPFDSWSAEYDDEASTAATGQDRNSNGDPEIEIKPLFSLELCTDMLLLSWEAYGEEPGSNHAEEYQGKAMPIDVRRHGYELLEVVHSCVDGKTVTFEKLHPYHPHPLSYRYLRAFTCSKCGTTSSRGEKNHSHHQGGMCYACGVCSRSARVSVYALCRSCFRNGLVEELEKNQAVEGAVTDDETDSELFSSVNRAADTDGEERRRARRRSKQDKKGRLGSMIQDKTDRAREGLKDLKDTVSAKGDAVRSEMKKLSQEARELLSSLRSQEDLIKTADLQAMICKNAKQIVVVFRGTHNLQNVKTDCHMTREVIEDMIHDKEFDLLDLSSWIYRLKRKSGFGLPRCHKGFLAAFHKIGPEVMKRLVPILECYPHHEICCTGHSLGGALTVLLAYWVRRYVGKEPVVYTFGSPRMGNSTFSALIDRNIPHIFRVVNQSDVIPTMPWRVFGTLYKHVGREVCVDKTGNLIIEPTFIERFIGPTKARTDRGVLGAFRILWPSASLTDHAMVNYAKSISRIAEYFKVTDCRVQVYRCKRTSYLQHRVRWNVDGNCILCAQTPSGLCDVSGNAHLGTEVLRCPGDQQSSAGASRAATQSAFPLRDDEVAECNDSQVFLSPRGGVSRIPSVLL